MFCWLWLFPWRCHRLRLRRGIGGIGWRTVATVVKTSAVAGRTVATVVKTGGTGERTGAIEGADRSASGQVFPVGEMQASKVFEVEKRWEDPDDEGALRAFRSGDRRAFDVLARTYRSRIHGICHRYTNLS